MPLPKTLDECKARAHAAAVETVKNWRKLPESDPRSGDWEPEVYSDAYGDALREMRRLLDSGQWGSGIDESAQQLIDLCRTLRFHADAPSAIGLVVGSVIRVAEEDYQHAPDIALAEFVAALIEIFGADKVRAAIDQTEQ